MKLFKNGIGRPSKDILMKRKKIYFMIFIFIIFLIVCFTNLLYKINLLDNLDGTVTTKEYNFSCDENSSCYKAGFRDSNFYGLIIDLYNNRVSDYNYDNSTEYDEDVEYEYQLSDEQLKVISGLTIDVEEIDDITGIEKLTDLKVLRISNYYDNNNFYESNLGKLDLSNSIKLNELELNNCFFSELLLSDEINSLALNNTSVVEKIDINNFTNLEQLETNINNIKPFNINNFLDCFFMFDIGLYEGENFDYNRLIADYDKEEYFFNTNALNYENNFEIGETSLTAKLKGNFSLNLNDKQSGNKYSNLYLRLKIYDKFYEKNDSSPKNKNINVIFEEDFEKLDNNDLFFEAILTKISALNKTVCENYTCEIKGSQFLIFDKNNSNKLMDSYSIRVLVSIEEKYNFSGKTEIIAVPIEILIEDSEEIEEDITENKTTISSSKKDDIKTTISTSEKEISTNTIKSSANTVNSSANTIISTTKNNKTTSKTTTNITEFSSTENNIEDNKTSDETIKESEIITEKHKSKKINKYVTIGIISMILIALVSVYLFKETKKE